MNGEQKSFEEDYEEMVVRLNNLIEMINGFIDGLNLEGIEVPESYKQEKLTF